MNAQLKKKITSSFFCQVITLDMGLLVAGTKFGGEAEEKLKNLMEKIRQSDDIILFIDEMHMLIGLGAVEGAINAANILKPALERCERQVNFIHSFFQSNDFKLSTGNSMFTKCFFWVRL